MIRIPAILALVLTTAAPALAESSDTEETLRVLMTVGGVGYHTSIVRNLKSAPGIDLTLRDVDEDERAFTSAVLAGIDTVLMYHRDNVAPAEEQEALLDYVNSGGGVVVLHHAIANYPAWESWWRDHVGGLYVLAGHSGLAPSRYFPDFRGVAIPTAEHPVTRRLGAYWHYQDESYDQLWISGDVNVLLRTNAFGSASQVAWIGPSDSNRVVFIQPGHGERVMTDPKFYTLIEDALRWTARPAD